jgi:cysteine desulfurase
MNKRRVYLDHNSTTPLHPEVKKEMIRAMEVFGNPSSMHQFGREARKMVEQARGNIASFIGAKPEEIIFTASASEGNNTVLNTFVCPSDQCNSNHSYEKKIITTTIEHPCVLETSKCLLNNNINVKFIEVDKYGKVKIDQLREELKKGPGLVSVMTANNEIGTIQDIKTISNIAHEYGSFFHTDAVQAVGKIPIDVNELGIDFLTLSGHKIYGPKGIGALYVRKGVPFCPLIRGGHQEQGRRAGTENTLGIVGLGKAIEMRKKEMEEEYQRLLNFKNKLKEGIESNIPDVKFNGYPTESLPNTLNVSFEGAEGEAIMLYLDLEGIAVSTGSACASGSLDPSHVILATGLSAEYAHGSIRMSMGRDTNESDINYVISVLPQIIKRIRKMSTVYNKGGVNE